LDAWKNINRLLVGLKMASSECFDVTLEFVNVLCCFCFSFFILMLLLLLIENLYQLMHLKPKTNTKNTCEEAQAALAAFRREQDAARAAVEMPTAGVDADGAASTPTVATVFGNSSREELPTVTPRPTKRGACTRSVAARRGWRKLTRT
jgi:hypothetical protein